jgi:uncharacterized metal-binding protein YceD (DUF177 family)
MTDVPQRGWSVPVRLDEVPESGSQVELAADAAVRAALARAAGVEAIPRLEARFDVVRKGRDGLHVTGRVSATVRQSCVVTLEPVENEVDEAVDLTFVAGEGDARMTTGAEDLAAHEAPDVLVNGTVDLGAIASEFLILGIDPYPRKAGAVFTAPASDDAADHPFAALAALKKPT